jgi:hypothetical protein
MSLTALLSVPHLCAAARGGAPTDDLWDGEAHSPTGSMVFEADTATEGEEGVSTFSRPHAASDSSG